MSKTVLVLKKLRQLCLSLDSNTDVEKLLNDFTKNVDSLYSLNQQ